MSPANASTNTATLLAKSRPAHINRAIKYPQQGGTTTPADSVVPLFQTATVASTSSWTPFHQNLIPMPYLLLPKVTCQPPASPPWRNPWRNQLITSMLKADQWIPSLTLKGQTPHLTPTMVKKQWQSLQNSPWRHFCKVALLLLQARSNSKTKNLTDLNPVPDLTQRSTNDRRRTTVN